eukprot:TRINITY_DN4501_c1_g1_i1.p1 TRINITY_DN4501_c1_g1~~TRINITY_DN4501_c1_g1_i1.p1  ORF type:complete len:120 (-),score=26.74 TRINITY_DN4501_c1_g1_i1:36-395(-)
MRKVREQFKMHSKQSFSILNIIRTDFQVVFVSFDKSEQEMREYMRGKPWPAASFQSNDRQALAYAFNANMLPTLVVLDGEGNFVTDWGRSAVSKNPQGCIEEWKRGNAGVTWFQMFKFW